MGANGDLMIPETLDDYTIGDPEAESYGVPTPLENNVPWCPLCVGDVHKASGGQVPILTHELTNVVKYLGIARWPNLGKLARKYFLASCAEAYGSITRIFECHINCGMDGSVLPGLKIA